MTRLSKVLASTLAPLLVLTSLSLGASAAYALDDEWTLDQARAQILSDVNNQRAIAGLPPMQADSTINNIAQGCSTTQASLNNMVHCSGYETQYPGGWSGASENVASGQYPDEVVDSWMASEGHRNNILNPASNRIGIGYALSVNGTSYFTQNFGIYTSDVSIPSVPTNVTATAGLNQATVSWGEPVTNGNTAITGYRVSYSPIDGSENILSVEVTDLSATITGLSGGKTYVFNVVAVNGAGDSYTRSSEATITGAPSNILTDYWNNHDGTYTFTWDWNDGGSPIIEQTLTLNGNPIVLDLAARQTTFPVAPASPVRLWLVATNAHASSVPADIQFISDAVAPSAPVNLDSTSVGLPQGETKVTWDVPVNSGGDNVYTYNVTLSTTQDGEIGSVNTNSRQHVFAGLERGQTYYFSVSATNSGGQGPDASGEFVTATTNPAPATNVVAELTDEQTITVNFTGSTDSGTDHPLTGEVFTYTVKGYVTGSNTPAFSRTVSGSPVVFDSNFVDANTNYTFTVVANFGGRSSTVANSNEVVVPSTPTRPDAVTDVNVVPGETSFDVSWNTPDYNGGSAITQYDVTLFDAGGNQVKTVTVAPEATSATFNNLVSYTRYIVRVEAVNDRGVSEPVNTGVRTLAVAPNPVTNLNATINPSGSATLTWSAPVPNSGATIQGYNWVVTVDDVIVGSGIVNTPGVVTPVLPADKTAVVIVNAFNADRTGNETTLTFDTGVSAGALNGSASSTTRDLNFTVDFVAPVYGDLQLVGYNVYYGSEGAFIYVPSTVPGQDISVDGNLIGLTDAHRGSNVSYQIAAVTGAGIVGAKTTRIVNVETVAPNAVTNITYTIDGNVINFAWDNSTVKGGPGYSNTIKIYDAGNSEVLHQVNGAGNTFSVPSGTGIFAPGAEYVFEVISSNFAYPQGVSAQAPFVTAVIPASAPQNLNVNAGTVSTGLDKVFVSWNAPLNLGGSALIGYQVSWTVNGVDAGSENVSASTRTHVINSLNARDNVVVTVKAITGFGAGASVSDNTQISYFHTSAPRNVQVTSTGMNNLGASVTWDAPSDLGGDSASNVAYTINFHNTVTGGNITVSTVKGSTVHNLPLGLEPLEEYEVTVYAVNSSNGLSPASQVVTIVPGIVAPSLTTNNVLSTVGNTRSLAVTFTHDNIQPWMVDEVTYKVTLFEADGDVVETINVGATDVKKATFTGLTRGAMYIATVTADFRSLVSSSDTNMVMVPVVAPTFDAFDLTVNGENLKVEWNDVSANGAPVDGYTLVVTADGVQIVNTSGAVTTDNFVIVPGVNPNVLYVATLTLGNTAGMSDTVTETVRSPFVAPSVVQNLAFDAVSGVISWDAPVSNGGDADLKYSGVIRYSNGDVVAFGSQDELEYAIDGYKVQAGVTMTIEITVRGQGGSAKTSLVYSEPAVAPGTVENLNIIVTGSVTVSASWAAPFYNGGADITGYQWELVDSSDTVVSSNTVTVTNVSLSGLNKGEVYTLNVRAVNSAGAGNWVTSNSVSTEPDFTPTHQAPAELDDFRDVVPPSVVTFDQVTGQLVITTTAFTGEWGFAYLEDGTPLGWAYRTTTGNSMARSVDSQFVFQVAPNLAVGNHNVYLYTTEDELSAYGEFTVAKAPVIPTPTPTPGAGNGQDAEKAKADDLARTGSEMNWVPLVSGLGLLVAGAGLYMIRRRKDEELA